MGVNVYLMCRQFHAAEAVIANAMIITTVVSSFTVPLAILAASVLAVQAPWPLVHSPTIF
jgi:predicted permease